jgi:hypothetical protein
MDSVKSSALVSVWIDEDKATIHDVLAWVAEVERLHIPKDTVLDECHLSVCFRSEIVDETFGESELGVEGYDILVGLPR